MRMPRSPTWFEALVSLMNFIRLIVKAAREDGLF